MQIKKRRARAFGLVLILLLFCGPILNAQERLCDASFEDCRQPLWQLIDAETVGIDVAFWYISDASYVTKLIDRFRAGLRVRVIVDPRANATKSSNATYLNQLQAAGVPMRYKSSPYDSGGIMHMKFMLFVGQNKLQFGSGNYSPFSFVTGQPFVDYTLNATYFTDDISLVRTFQTEFDNLWTDTVNYSNYANITGPLTRHYPIHPADPGMNFAPGVQGVDYDSFALRSIDHINQETQKIDAAIFRTSDSRVCDAIIAAVNRGIPVRLITEPDEYRTPERLWHAYNIDRMYSAGVQIKKRVHRGEMHQNSFVAYGQGLAAFGSSSWVVGSSNSQAEHNYFTTKPWVYQWFVNQFESKWGSATEYQPFTPLAPDQPINQLPANGATAQSTDLKLVWQGGPWAHKYDIYFGINPNPPLVASNVSAGSPQDAILETYTPPALGPSKTYYWRVVGKTMANLTVSGPVYNFTTASTQPSLSPTVTSISPSSGTGKGQNTVTISGTNFSPGATVLIGGSLATSASVINSNSITATAPAHSAGVVDVTVINGDGQSSTLGRAYTYKEPPLLPAPVVTAVSPNSGGTGGGSVITIRGTGFSAGSTVAFGGTPATNIVVNSYTSISATTPPHTAGLVDVVVNTPDDLGGSLAGGYTYLSSAPNPQPGVTGISPNSGTINGGDSVTIAGTGFLAGAAVTIGGVPATGVSVQSGTTITAVTPAHAAGAVNVAVTNTDGQSGTLAGGYTYTPPQNQPPQVSVSASTTGGGAPLTVSFTSNAADPDGHIVTYSWAFGDGQTSTQQAPSHTYQSAGTFTARLSVTDNLGATASASVVISVSNPTPPSLTDIVLYAAEAEVRAGSWNVVADATAAGGARLSNPDQGAPKLGTALANPTNYFEMSFTAQAGQAYRLWVRGKAQNNHWANDSAFVQFSGSVDSNGAALYRIGTTSATVVSIEEGNGAGVSNWGWQDNGYGYGAMGPLVYFQATGTQTLRVQVREDGLSIDQIVLSPQTYLNNSPGALMNDNTILPKNGGGSPAPTVTLVRHPYLQQVIGDTARIVWATREPGPAEARYWLNGGPINTTQATTTYFPSSTTGMAFDYYQHEARLSNLSPATSYNYDLFLNQIDVTPGLTDRLKTAPVPGTGSVRFIAFGDSGIGSVQQQQLATLMSNDSFDIALHGGDVVYGTSSTTGGANYPQYHDWFFAIYKDWLRSHAFFPSIGNHDNAILNARAYRDLFALPENGASAAFPDHAERYYSFDYGPVHFVALDTELAFQNATRRQEQLNWLAADLAATRQPWKVAFFHRSPYSSGGEHGSDLAVRQAFGPVLEQYGVHLAISAHEHTYERTVPWREGTASNQAVTYIVTGGGGARLYPAGRDAWTAASASAYHYLRGTISGCTLTLETVGIDGTVIDQFSLDKCAQANDTAPPVVSITSPAAGATVSGTVTVNTSASDDIRIEKVDLWVDGALNAIDTAAPFEFSLDTRGLTDGAHTIEARAYDIDGNRAASPTRTIQVQNSAPTPGEIVLYAAQASVKVGSWTVVSDATAAGGARLSNPDQGAAKITPPLASPTNYFEMTFNAQAGQAYHLWIRGKAQNDSYQNDSTHVQFSDSVDSSGNAIYRIGTTNAAEVTLEDCFGAGEQSWGWNDNGWCGMGVNIYFANSGTHTIRIQVREDGFSIDQIVLSPQIYLNNSPGALKNDTTILPR